MHAYAQMSKLKDTKTHEQSTEKIAEQKLYESEPQSMNRHKRIHVYIRGLSKTFVNTCNFFKIEAPLSGKYYNIVIKSIIMYIFVMEL